MKYDFEWDPNKAKGNTLKHKISFERAAQIFLDPFQVSILDERHSGNDERWITIAKDGHEVLLVVVHGYVVVSNERCKIRIISARKATKKEAKQYEAL